MAFRRQFNDVIIDVNGNALASANAFVYNVGTTTPVTIYSTRTGSTQLTNPITTTSNGNVLFWVNPGTYDVKFQDTITPARFTTRTITIEAVSGDTTGGIAVSQLENVTANSAILSDANGKWITGQVDAARLAANAVTNPKIADLSVGTTKIVDDAVTAPKLAGGAVTTGSIVAGTITATELATDCIGTLELQDNAVTTLNILDANVTLAKLATDSVNSAKIVAGSIVGADIANNTIGAANIGIDAITSSELAPNAVGASELADNAVDSAALATGAVTLGKIGANAVTATEIAADAVTSAEIARVAIQADEFNATTDGAGYASGTRTLGTAMPNASYTLVMFASAGGWACEWWVSGKTATNFSWGIASHESIIIPVSYVVLASTF